MHDQNGQTKAPSCPECGGLFMAWITTCPQCAVPLANEAEERDLAHQVAPVVQPAYSWLDIAISSDEPVKVALLTQLLNEREIPFESSRRFVSVESQHAEELEAAIHVWAFTQDLPDDDRELDSLAATLREIGYAVYASIHGSAPANMMLVEKASVSSASPSDITLD